MDRRGINSPAISCRREGQPPRLFYTSTRSVQDSHDDTRTNYETMGRPHPTVAKDTKYTPTQAGQVPESTRASSHGLLLLDSDATYFIDGIHGLWASRPESATRQPTAELTPTSTLGSQDETRVVPTWDATLPPSASPSPTHAAEPPREDTPDAAKHAGTAALENVSTEQRTSDQEEYLSLKLFARTSSCSQKQSGQFSAVNRHISAYYLRLFRTTPERCGKPPRSQGKGRSLRYRAPPQLPWLNKPSRPHSTRHFTDPLALPRFVLQTRTTPWRRRPWTRPNKLCNTSRSQ